MVHRHNNGRTPGAWTAIFNPIRAARPWLAAYWALLGLTIAWLYWPVLSGEVPAFRDAFHFYYPLEFWLAARADAGQYLPHFNPYDGTGANLVGETSSGLCYPGRILWWIPGLSPAQRFGVVLAVHTMIAAAGAAYAAKRLTLSPAAGCLAATAYSLGGAVLFQHVNPVYLIGAAWVPWALAECWVLVCQGEDGTFHKIASAGLPASGELRPRMGVWVGAATLMLLGGDPQATVNAGIVALLALATRLAITRSWRVFGRQFAWLACAVVIVGGLTAIQWIPARLWLQHSQRTALRQDPVSEAEDSVGPLPQLLRPLKPPPPVRGTYAYSVAPWHLFTLVWGTAGGHFLPEHTRWPAILANEPRMWTASLSLGLLPALLIVAGWSTRSSRTRQRFLIVVVLVSGAAMLGNYAPVWMLRQLCHAVGADQWSRLLPGDEVGSVYWCFTKIVPGYSAFRYPAKWSVWFACALALCAASAFDLQQERSRAFARLCTVVAVVSAVGALAAAWLRWLPSGTPTLLSVSKWLTTAPADVWLGRPDPAAVVQVWLQAAIVATAVPATCAVLMRLNGRAHHLRALIVLLTLGELAWAGNRWIVTLDTRRLDVQQANGGADSGADLFERVWAGAGRAGFESWQTGLANPAQRQHERVERLANYQLAFRLGKLHLLNPPEGNLAAFLSLPPRALSAVRHQLAQADDLRPINPPLDEALAWLGVSRRLARTERLQWQAVPRARPLVELVADATAARAARAPADNCSVEHFGADQITIQVSSLRASQMIVRLLQDGGWSATLTSLDGAPRAGARRAVIHRTPSSSHLGLFQTLSVPAGDWIIELSYRAPGWQLGQAITLGTSLAVLAFFLLRYRKRWWSCHCSVCLVLGGTGSARVFPFEV